jgi:hypothetical protein
MDAWRRDFAAAFAAAVPMEAAGTQARGALLAASNDEPEPLFTEAELLEADRARQQRKDEECRNLTRACDEREMRRTHVGSEWDRATWMRTAL